MSQIIDFDILNTNDVIDLDVLDNSEAIDLDVREGGGGGTTDYNMLSNKPQINGVTLTGNKTSADLGIQAIPTGGTEGQVLAKASDSDYDAEWVDAPGGEVTQEAFDALVEYVHDLSPVTTVSGAIAAVDDAAPLDAEDVVVDIAPVQDLHGYDSPWPAGGGVNKVKLSDAISSFSGAYGFTVALDGEMVKISGVYSGTNTTASFRLAYLNTTLYDYTNLSVKGFVVSGITSGNVYTNVVRYGNSNKNDIAIDLLNLVPQQQYNILLNVVFYEGSTAPTAWTPYSNVCPITGWTGANVTRAGKNLYNKTQYPFTRYGVYNSSVCWTPPIFVKHGTYKFSCSSGFSTCYISVYKTFEDATANANRLAQYVFNNGSSITETFDEDVYARYQQNGTGGTDEDYAKVSQSWQAELGSTATAYEPYVGDTYSVSWQSEAGTVYGGTLDVTAGTLTVDRAMVDLGTLTWNYVSNGTYFYAIVSGKANGYDNVSCSTYKTSSAPGVANLPDKAIVGENSGTAVLIKDSAYSDAATFQTAMSGVQLVYELATPVVYQLTPHEIALLRGSNTLFADTGDTSLTYRQDVGILLSKLTAQVAALNAAVANT